jgi:hypothetical protein
VEIGWAAAAAVVADLRQRGPRRRAGLHGLHLHVGRRELLLLLLLQQQLLRWDAHLRGGQALLELEHQRLRSRRLRRPHGQRRDGQRQSWPGQLRALGWRRCLLRCLLLLLLLLFRRLLHGSRPTRPD